jgi:hypothetical protein
MRVVTINSWAGLCELCEDLVIGNWIRRLRH